MAISSIEIWALDPVKRLCQIRVHGLIDKSNTDDFYKKLVLSVWDVGDIDTMAKGAENTKKAAGNAKKAEAAAQKARAEGDKIAAKESEEWSKGAKSSAKKDAAAEKAAEAAKKKAEKEALLKAEEESLPSKPKGEGKKTAQKKNAAPSKGTLDLGKLDVLDKGAENPKATLNASGIENALDALSLANTTGSNDKIDKHPERRFKAAYSAYEERRLAEMADEKGLRRQQKIDQIRKEFEKSPENPFNQELVGRYDMSKEEAADARQSRREQVEKRLGTS